MFEGKESGVWYEPAKDKIWLECKSGLFGSWFISEDHQGPPNDAKPFIALYLPKPELEGLIKIEDF